MFYYTARMRQIVTPEPWKINKRFEGFNQFLHAGWVSFSRRVELCDEHDKMSDELPYFLHLSLASSR